MAPKPRLSNEEIQALTQSLIQRDPAVVTRLAKITFFLLGVASLMSWNAVLTGLDFFASKFTNYNVYFLFSIPLFIGQNIVCLFISFISKFLTLRRRIIGGQLITVALMISLPIIAFFVPTDVGFWVDMVIIFFMGCANAVLQSSGIAFASTFPFICVSLFFTGTAVAGVSINVLRIIFLGIFQTGEDGVAYGVVCYFLISTIFAVCTVFVYACFFNSTYCKIALNEMRRKTEIHIEDYVENILVSPLEKDMLIYEEDETTQVKSSENTTQQLAINKDGSNNETKIDNKYAGMANQRNTVAFVWKVFKNIQPYPIMCWLIYVITFMLFPGEN